MKKTIQLKLFTLSLILILFTTAGITIPYYFLTKLEKENASRVRLGIAFSIINEDIQELISSDSSRIDDFFQQVSAIPWELSWYQRKESKQVFFADPTYSSYIVTIGDEFRRFSRFVSADRISLYGADKRLIVAYFRNEETEMTGAYIVNQDGNDSFLTTMDYSRYLITRQPLPESPLPSELTANLDFEAIPDNPVNEHFSSGARFGLKMTVPIYHKAVKVGAMVVEMPYTTGLLEKYARLSRTDVVIHRATGHSMGTLRVHEEFPVETPALFGAHREEMAVSALTVEGVDYYRSSFSLEDHKGETAGVVSIYLDRSDEKKEILTVLRTILIIAFLIIILAFGLTVLFSRRTLHFIIDLTRATSDIADGNLNRTIPLGGDEEHSLLALSISKMRDAIIGQIGQLERRIDEEKKMTRELKVSREKLSATLRSIGEGVITCDTRGCVQSLNPAAEELTGFSSPEASGLPIEKVFPITDPDTGESVDNPVYQALAGGTFSGLTRDAILTNYQGREYPVAESSSPIRDREGQIFGAVLIFRDMTEEKALQERFRQSQKMDAVGQLAGGVAHDFNNMLGGIMGAADLLNVRLEDDSELSEYTGIILESAERAADLAAKLLAFSRRQVAHSTAVDLHSVVGETVALLKNTLDKRISIRTDDLRAETSIIKGDKALLQSVFLNLGINASHAMPEGGELIFSSKRVHLDPDYCRASQFDLTPGDYLELAVSDTGTGIEADVIHRIFEPFYTTKEQGKGTGLGLAAAYGTIRQHKGAINVFSKIGQGTSFLMDFPLSEEAAEIRDTASDPHRGEGLVLIADDEKVMRFTGKAILEDLGYQVLLAENGTRALELFRENLGKIDLVILDMIMPDKNGRDCFEEIQGIVPGVPVIMSSGFLQSEDLAEMNNRGLNGFIQKPYRGVELSRIVSRVLGKS